MPKNLEGNIWKFNLYRIFTKRVFLPLIVIFLIDYGKVSLEEIALIASITAVVQFILEIPSGYIADKWGHKKSLICSAIIVALSVLPYIFIPGFWGGLFASALFFGGFAFASGTTQAFMHETLQDLGRDSEYSQVMGRGQTYGLAGNILLVALVPLTYTLHPKLPFILGFICSLISLAIVLSFVEPKKRVSVAEEGYKRGTWEKLRLIGKKVSFFRLFLVFLFFGIASASFDQGPMFREVAFRDVGIPVAWFGALLGIGSLLAAIGGWYIHHLKKLSSRTFYIFDGLYLVIVFLLVSVSQSPLFLILAFSLFPAYNRTRDIIFEAHVLEEFPHSQYKATIISIMNFFSLLSAIWVPLLFGFLIGRVGLSQGYAAFGLIVGFLLALVFLFYVFVSRKTVTPSPA